MTREDCKVYGQSSNAPHRFEQKQYCIKPRSEMEKIFHRSQYGTVTTIIDIGYKGSIGKTSKRNSIDETI